MTNAVTYTLSILASEAPNANGEEFGNSELDCADLDPEVWEWMAIHGVGSDDGPRVLVTPEVWEWMASHGVGSDDGPWVLVTPGGEHPGELAGLVAQREVTINRCDVITRKDSE